jgi:hypothetical protein
VRSNAFINSPWQLREFKTDINTKGEAVFVADSVKSNPLAELFAKEGSLDSDSLKDGQWVRFNAVGNKNSLSFGIDIGFKFSKLPWTVNECVLSNL